MPILDWPEAERPREKLLNAGANTLSDAELLAIFLRTGTRGLTAVDLARAALQRFGSLRTLLNATESEFCQQHGLGSAKYVQLQAVLELARRHLGETLQRDTQFANASEVSDYLIAQLRDRPYEVFAVLLLDTRHRLIEFTELFRGSISGAAVYSREVVKTALAQNAAAVIFAHNHPSGVAEPSQADRDLTSRLQQALDLVEIRVLDHIVVGDGKCVSFASRGWL